MTRHPPPLPKKCEPKEVIAASFPAMAALAKTLEPEIRLVENRLWREEEKGRDTSGLRQILRELHWRLGSTADPAATCETLKWLRELDASGNPPSTPPRAHFLDAVNDPDRLRFYLSNLLLSKPAEDGIDRRKEPNLSTANLVRLILRGLPKGYLWHRKLEEGTRRFVAERQDPKSGFFGASYEVEKRRWRTADLSLTFHMARYLDGGIGYWPQLADTLFAMREERYPNGWLDEAGITNHKNYDIATLFRLGWKAIRPDQRRKAAGALDHLLEWCLGSAIAADGRVVARAVGDRSPKAITSRSRFWTRSAALPRAELFGAIAPSRVPRSCARRSSAISPSFTLASR